MTKAKGSLQLRDDVEGAIDRAESMVFDVAQRRVTDTLSPIKELLDASLTRLLLDFGLRNFSMHAQQLLAIKERVLRTNLAEAQPLAQRVLRQSDPARTRELIAKLNS